jgi:ankyrin repeat protein
VARRGVSPHPEPPTGLRDAREGSDPTRERSLHEAAADADAATVRSLLERGADVHARNVLLQTPLHVAVRSPIFVWMHTPRQFEVVERLLDAGADPNARDGSGATPLHTALEDLYGFGSANFDVVKLLLLRGADPDARSAEGLRPTDRLPHVRGHISPGDIMQEIARRSALLDHANEMLDAARRGTLA